MSLKNILATASALASISILFFTLGCGCGGADMDPHCDQKPPKIPSMCGNDNPTVPSDTGHTGDFGAAAGDAAGIRADTGAVKSEMGDGGVKAPPSLPGGVGGLAATAQDKNTSPKLSAPGGHGPAATPGMNVNLPHFGASGAGNNGGGAASGLGAVGGEGKDTAAGAAGGSADTAAAAKELTSGASGYEGGESGGGAAKGANGAPGFAGAFAGDAENSVGGAAGANFGNTGADGEAGGASMEDYLGKVGRTSLFEVINHRTHKFATELETAQSIKEFKKISQ